jgi:hypothetical protein
MTINNNPVHNTPAWLLLTQEATRFVREHESPSMHYNWCCKHCAHHFEKQVGRADVIEHAKKVYAAFFHRCFMTVASVPISCFRF